jgi:hypothetical protein
MALYYPDLNEIHAFKGDTEISCLYCDGKMTKETPMLAGQEKEKVRDIHIGSQLVRILDPRPKCPHCMARFVLVIHFEKQEKNE